jgi:branched-chain amino acid transport system substrate-binding protein
MSNSVPLIAPVSGAGSLRGLNRRFVYNVRAGYAQESQRVARQLSSMGLSSVAVVYQDNPGGREGASIFEIACRELGMKVVSSQKVGGTRSTPQGAARAVAQASPNAVVLFATYDIGTEIIRASRAAGYAAMFMTVSSAGSKALNEELLDDARGMGMTQVMPYPWSGTLPLVREYQQRMLENGFSQKDFSYGSLEGFVAARVVVEGLRRSGKGLSAARLADALDNLGEFDLGGLQLNYSPRSREASKFVDLTVMGPGGKFLK